MPIDPHFPPFLQRLTELGATPLVSGDAVVDRRALPLAVAGPPRRGLPARTGRRRRGPHHRGPGRRPRRCASTAPGWAGCGRADPAGGGLAARRGLGGGRPGHPRPGLPRGGQPAGRHRARRRLPAGPRAPAPGPAGGRLAAVRWAAQPLADRTPRGGRGQRRRRPGRRVRAALPGRGRPGAGRPAAGLPVPGPEPAMPSVQDNGTGLFLERADMRRFWDWYVPGDLAARPRSSPRWAPTSPGCRRPSWPPPSSTRCATRATPTPSSSPRPACPSSTCPGRAWCTATSG